MTKKTTTQRNENQAYSTGWIFRSKVYQPDDWNNYGQDQSGPTNDTSVSNIVDDLLDRYATAWDRLSRM